MKKISFRKFILLIYVPLISYIDGRIETFVHLL